MYEVIDAFGFEENWDGRMEFAQKISKKTPSMLKFAKKLTIAPQKVTEYDRREIREEGGLTDVEMLGNYKDSYDSIQLYISIYRGKINILDARIV